MRSGKKGPIVVFLIGLVTLAGGLGFLIYKLASAPGMADAEFLVSSGQWTREDTKNVVWNFTEIGKGKLTTDDHTNDYDFIWALDGNKIKIETAWLYDLNDEFEYKLDQKNKILTLKDTSKNIEIKFKAE